MKIVDLRMVDLCRMRNLLVALYIVKKCGKTVRGKSTPEVCGIFPRGSAMSMALKE